MTCWRRRCDRREAGVWERVHRLLLERLRDEKRADIHAASMTLGCALIRAGRLGSWTCWWHRIR
jgi:hypothetical protein